MFNNTLSDLLFYSISLKVKIKKRAEKTARFFYNVQIYNLLSSFIPCSNGQDHFSLGFIYYFGHCQVNC